MVRKIDTSSFIDYHYKKKHKTVTTTKKEYLKINERF